MEQLSQVADGEPERGGRAGSSGVRCGGAGMERGRQEEGLLRVWGGWIPVLGITSPAIPALLWQRSAGPCPDPGKQT